MDEIDMELVVQEWTKAKEYTDNYTTDFRDLDNLVDGIPITREKGSPYVGDTTLAGLKRSIPRASLQQLPVFSVVVNGSKNTIPSHTATYLLRRGVFNQDTFGKGLLSTCQIGGEEALTHGYAPFITATGSMYNDFGTTMKLLHYSNVSFEPGIQDSNEASYFYVDADLTKSRVKKICKAAKNNDSTSWNTEALEELLEMEPEGSDYTQYLSSARGGTNPSYESNTYKLVTRYEVGKGGRFVTFSPQLKEKPLRIIPNKSKFGYPRVQLLVIDPAPLTPFGLSRVKLASPNQNLMNAYYQNVASMFILNSKPPLLIRGRFVHPVQLKQGQRWETLDQNASVELKELSNSTLQQFVPMAQQMSAQIQNIMGSPQGTSNGNTNSMGFSKTAPGVKMQQNSMDMSTSQLTNIMENFLRQYALVALDTYICEQTVEIEDPENPNEDELILDDEAKNAINRVAPGTVGEDNKLTMNWNEFYDGIDDWTIEIELSVGKDELDEKQRGDLQDMLTTLLQNDDGTDPEMKVKIRELMDMLMEKTVPQAKRISATSPATMQPPQTVAPVPTPGADPQLTQ